MQDTTISERLCLPNQALLFDLDALYVQLQRITDLRHRRGVRYPLAPILMIGVLAKLAGYESSRQMAHWAQLRAQELRALFVLKRESMPHYSTWSRVLGQAVDPREIEQILGQFFAKATRHSQPKPGERLLCLDGKTLRGTIPLGKSQGVHLLAAYLPEEGVVLAQVQVNGAGNEPTQAPALLSTLDLRGMIVSGDAIFAQRALSLKVIQAKGDYLWIVKGNRNEVYQDIQALFEPPTSRPGWSAPPTDFRTAQTIEKGHGRIEKRRITVSSMLASYSDWPGLSQVFKLERVFTDMLGQSHQEVRYGMTSLLTSQANARRLLALTRGHWGIENGLHYRRDATLREDHSQLRMGHAPHVLAVLNNTVLGLLARQGVTNVAEARRQFAYQVDRALHTLAS